MADRRFSGHEWPPQLHTANMAAVHEKKLPLPPEQAIGILGDDRNRRRRTQNDNSNDARRRIVQMKKEMPPDRRPFSLHEQKAFGDVGWLPASRVGIIRVRQVLPGHKYGPVIGSTCRKISYSTMWERCFLIGGMSIFGGSTIYRAKAVRCLFGCAFFLQPVPVNDRWCCARAARRCSIGRAGIGRADHRVSRNWSAP